jgi:hypothetical protein
MTLISESSHDPSIQTASDDPSEDSSIQTDVGDPPLKRPVSTRKIEANRNNALRSTGPRTVMGKLTASRNSIKHGFFTPDVVNVEGFEGSREDFDALLEGLRDFYEPDNILEDFLVRNIAICFWKKERIIRAENGQIHKQLDAFAQGQAERALDAAKESFSEYETDFPANVSAMEIVICCDSAKSDLRKHSVGRTYLAELLKAARIEIMDDIHLSNMTAAKLFLLFDLWDHPFALACLHAASSAEEGEGDPRASEDDGDIKDNIESSPMVALDAQLETISLSENRAVERAILAKAQSFLLLPADVIDGVIRYGSHIEKQLYRAIKELERLQRQRKGENVPPPLN